MCKLNRHKPACKRFNCEGFTAVHLLAKCGAVFALEQLAADGVDIKKRDAHSETVLFHGLGTGQCYSQLIELYRHENGDLDELNALDVI